MSHIPQANNPLHDADIGQRLAVMNSAHVVQPLSGDDTRVRPFPRSRYIWSATVDTFVAGDVLWPEGWTRLHLYVLPNLAEIKDLVDIYQSVIAEFPFMSPVPDEWLHAIVQMIEQPAARDVTPKQLDDLSTNLRENLAGVSSFTLTAGGAVAGRSGVVLDMTPDTKFSQIVHRSRAIIADVLGDEAVKYSHARPHVTLAYACDHGDSVVVQSKLRNATDRRATMTVDEVSLVDVIQDPTRHQYRWKRIDRFALNGTDDSNSESTRPTNATA